MSTSEELMEKHADARSPDHAVELERVREGGLSAEEQAEHQRLAEFNAHPHTQLTKLLTDLQTPPLDLNARIAHLRGGIARLAQIVLQHTPPPNEPTQETGNGEGK